MRRLAPPLLLDNARSLAPALGRNNYWMMDIVCTFEGGEAGELAGESVPVSGTPVPFMPYRSMAHMRLGQALARDGSANVELRGPGIAEGRRVIAMTVRSITLASREHAT